MCVVKREIERERLVKRLVRINTTEMFNCYVSKEVLNSYFSQKVHNKQCFTGTQLKREALLGGTTKCSYSQSLKKLNG